MTPSILSSFCSFLSRSTAEDRRSLSSQQGPRRTEVSFTAAAAKRQVASPSVRFMRRTEKPLPGPSPNSGFFFLPKKKKKTLVSSCRSAFISASESAAAAAWTGISMCRSSRGVDRDETENAHVSHEFSRIRNPVLLANLLSANGRMIRITRLHCYTFENLSTLQ